VSLRKWLATELPLLISASNADHLEMWRMLAEEYDWARPLLVLAQRVLFLPASEAHSERTISQVQ
jgi:hypothetical protein